MIPNIHRVFLVGLTLRVYSLKFPAGVPTGAKEIRLMSTLLSNTHVGDTFLGTPFLSIPFRRFEKKARGVF